MDTGLILRALGIGLCVAISTQILTIAAPYYIDLIREYLRFTGDVAFVKSMTGVCDRLLSFYENSRNEQGLVLPPYGCRFIDWVDGWEIGTPKGFENKPLTVESLMYAAALKSAGEICEASGRFGLAAEYKSRYTDLISCINEHCFDKKRGLYLDGPDLNTYCEHSTVWAILSGAIKGEEARELMLRSMASNEVARCSFSKNYDTLRALEKTGLYEEYAPKILLQWKDMIDKHCTTWVEDPVSERSECHGWSSVPMYEASAMILGVYPLSDGFKGVRIKPTTLGLSFARGRVPTPCGFIDVAWWYESDKFHMQVKCSNTMEMVIICPNGDTLKVENDNFEI